MDRRFYELCVLSELKNALRSGDIWVEGSRQFKDFEDVPAAAAHDSRAQQQQGALRAGRGDRLRARSWTSGSRCCEQQLAARGAAGRAQTNCRTRPSPAPALEGHAAGQRGARGGRGADAAGATRCCRTSRSPSCCWKSTAGPASRATSRTSRAARRPTTRRLLLTAILADAINLGLTKMAESCPGMTYARLSWLQAWHIRDETYSAALAELVNAQFRQPFAALVGRRHHVLLGRAALPRRRAGRSRRPGEPEVRQEPGVQFYTHLSDQYAPFHTKVINATVRDATYVLDGLLYHESDLRIEEHYTDTAGFTDHVFALMHLLGLPLRAAHPRPGRQAPVHPRRAEALPDAGRPDRRHVNSKHIRTHWDEILRLATSIRQGTVTASLMLRKLGSYPRQNGLAVALRELGRIERTLFTLDWLQRRRAAPPRAGRPQQGRGASNALARAVFFNRLGELRDRSFENQRYRASGLNLVVAAIVLWNTVYLERAVQALREHGQAVDDDLLQHLSPLGWEHINLTGDYVWRQRPQLGSRQVPAAADRSPRLSVRFFPFREVTPSMLGSSGIRCSGR